MKKVLTILLSICLLSLVGCKKKDDLNHLDSIKEKGKIIIATEGVWAPWTYEEDGKLKGFDVEIGERIAKELDVEVEFVTGDFDGFLQGLSAGIYDLVINGIDITEKRKEAYDFSDPYAYAYSLLIVASDNNSIKSFDDLKGLKFSNSVGSSYEALGESLGATNIGGDTFSDTILNILNGRCDFTINSAETYYDYLKEHNDGKIKVVTKTDNPLEVAIPFNKGEYNDSFKAEINRIIKEMREDGSLKELSLKYFGGDLTSK